MFSKQYNLLPVKVVEQYRRTRLAATVIRHAMLTASHGERRAVIALKDSNGRAPRAEHAGGTSASDGYLGCAIQGTSEGSRARSA